MGDNLNESQTAASLREEMRKLQEELANLRNRVGVSERIGGASDESPGVGNGGGVGAGNPPRVISGIRAESLKVHRFDGTDYDLWAFMMIRNLKIAQVWDVVEKGWVVPAEQNSMENSGENGSVEIVGNSGPTTEWLAKNTEAEGLILQGVAKNQLATLTSCRSAKEMWEKLASNYADKSRANRMKAERDFLNCTMRRGQSMEEYIRTFDTLCTRLRSLGHHLDEESQVNRLLEGLSPEYEVIRITLQDRDDLTYDQACAKLLANARIRPGFAYPTRPRVHIAETNPEGGATVGANAVTGKSKKGQKGQKGACYICGDKKHYSNKCPYKNGDNKRKLCHICKKEGHLKANCPEKADAQEQSATAETREIRPWSAVAIVQEEHAAYSVNVKEQQRSCWIIDSGATHHMSNDLKWFTTAETPNISKWIHMADTSTVKVNKEGKVKMQIPEKDCTTVLELGEVLYVPELGKNLFSVSHALMEGINIEFDAEKMECRLTKAGEHVAKAFWRDNLWLLEGASFVEPGQDLRQEKRPIAASASIGGSLNLWHHRLGHLGEENLLKLARMNMVKGIPEKLTGEKVRNNCVGCAQGKQHKKPFGERRDKTSNLLELVHTDVMGPFSPMSIGGKRYVLVIVDDYSRCTFVAIMASKDEVHYHLTTWITYAERATGKSVKVLRSDNGGEFTSKALEEDLQQLGIEHQLTLPYTPEHNGVVERANRVLMECARSMLFAAQLSKGFWGEAVVTACYLKNRSPHKGLIKANLEVTPCEVWSGRKPAVDHLRVFGCRASVLIPEVQRSKLDQKSWSGIMVGYAKYGGYRIWDPVKKRVVESRNVLFDENLNRTGKPILTRNYLELDNEKFGETPQEEASPDWKESTVHFWHTQDVQQSRNDLPNRDEELPQENGFPGLEEHDTGGPNLEELQPENHENPQEMQQRIFPEIQGLEDPQEGEERVEEEESNTRELEGPRRSSRTIRKPRKLIYLKPGEPSLGEFGGATTLSKIPVPGSFREAMSGPNVKEWKQAIQEEMESHIKNQTWTLQKLPKGRRALKNKWVLALKERSDGSIRFKGRLVIKGFMQVAGIDYEETYAPVIKLQSLRMLMAIANQDRMEVHQMDVKTAFLNGYLEEEIYMVQPEGQEIPGKEDLVCKLNRSLYGLKQSPRCWNKVLDEFLIEKLHFRRCLADKATYVRGQGDLRVYIGVYVDDLLIISRKLQEITQVKQVMSARFEMVDFGPVSTVLGIRIIQDLKKGTLTMSQEKYVRFLLEKYGMEACKPTQTPMVTGVKLSKQIEPKTKEEEKDMERIPYRSAVGSLMYLMVCTRPDIASAIGLVSRFLQNPGRAHWEAVKRVFRYLKQTQTIGLRYVRKEGEIELEGFTDADWGGCPDTRRSTGAYVFKLGGAAVSWASRRQTSVALSTCEAEYMAACTAAKEAVWLKEMMCQLGCPRNGAVQIRTDSESAINLIKNPVLHNKTKHIGIQYHYVRELKEREEIRFSYCPTDLMIADSLTKAVPREKVEFCRSQMGLQEV